MEETLNFEVGDRVCWRPEVSPFTKGNLGEGPFIVSETRPVPDNPRLGVGHHQWLVLKRLDGSIITESRREPATFSGALFQKASLIVAAKA